MAGRTYREARVRGYSGVAQQLRADNWQPLAIHVEALAPSHAAPRLQLPKRLRTAYCWAQASEFADGPARSARSASLSRAASCSCARPTLESLPVHTVRLHANLRAGCSHAWSKRGWVCARERRRPSPRGGRWGSTSARPTACLPARMLAARPGSWLLMALLSALCAGRPHRRRHGLAAARRPRAAAAALRAPGRRLGGHVLRGAPDLPVRIVFRPPENTLAVIFILWGSSEGA